MTKSFNIILFGETGVGKSSLVNLIAGKEVAPISSDSDACTLSFRPYTFQVYGASYTIWDTRGFSEADTGMGGKAYLVAIEQAYKLIRELSTSGGVDLLVLCHREGRITTTTRDNYRLFYEVFCDTKVPLAIVITHLERHARMEDWWDQNFQVFQKHEMMTATHACVTALSGHTKSPESKQAIESMLGQHDENGKYNMPQVEWLRRFLQNWGRFRGRPKELKKCDLERFLRERCGLAIRDAREIATMMLAERHNK